MKRKKVFAILAMFVLSMSLGVLVYAAAVVTTSCGEKVSTVDQQAFETYGEWMDYMADLNEAYCGTRSGTMRYQERP